MDETGLDKTPANYVPLTPLGRGRRRICRARMPTQCNA